MALSSTDASPTPCATAGSVATGSVYRLGTPTSADEAARGDAINDAVGDSRPLAPGSSNTMRADTTLVAAGPRPAAAAAPCPDVTTPVRLTSTSTTSKRATGRWSTTLPDVLDGLNRVEAAPGEVCGCGSGVAGCRVVVDHTPAPPAASGEPPNRSTRTSGSRPSSSPSLVPSASVADVTSSRLEPLRPPLLLYPLLPPPPNPPPIPVTPTPLSSPPSKPALGAGGRTVAMARSLQGACTMMRCTVATGRFNTKVRAEAAATAAAVRSASMSSCSRIQRPCGAPASGTWMCRPCVDRRRKPVLKVKLQGEPQSSAAWTSTLNVPNPAGPGSGSASVSSSRLPGGSRQPACTLVDTHVATCIAFSFVRSFLGFARLLCSASAAYVGRFTGITKSAAFRSNCVPRPRSASTCPRASGSYTSATSPTAPGGPPPVP